MKIGFHLKNILFIVQSLIVFDFLPQKLWWNDQFSMDSFLILVIKLYTGKRLCICSNSMASIFWKLKQNHCESETSFQKVNLKIKERKIFFLVDISLFIYLQICKNVFNSEPDRVAIFCWKQDHHDM